VNPRIFVLTLTTLAFGSTAFIFTGVLDQMAHDLGVSVAVAGQLQTAYVLASALTGPPLALLLGRRERKRLILTGVGLLCVLNAVCAFGGDFQHLVILRALMGAGGGLIGPAASTAAAALAPPEKRGSALATVTGGVTLAFILGIPLGSVVGATFGWRASFALAALMAGIAFAGVALFLPRVTPPPVTVRVRAPWAMILPLVGLSFLGFASNMLVNAYIGPILRVGTGVTGAGVGAFQMLIGLGSIAGLAIGARSANRGAPKLMMAGAFAIQGLAMAVHANELAGGAPTGWPTYAAVSAAILLLAIALFGLMPQIQTRIMALAGHSAPVALALGGSANALGQGFGAAFGGVVLSHVGLIGLPLTGIAISIAGCMACLLVPPPLAKPLAPEG
jgi:predicted MFS family arabinose efflux permease